MSAKKIGEWGNAEQVFEQFGLTKGTLFKLAAAGKIRSTSIKTVAGARKGVRLFELASIRALLAQSIS
jgi:hypothetical protein